MRDQVIVVALATPTVMVSSGACVEEVRIREWCDSKSQQWELAVTA